jgi:N-acetylmuramoyl-L-alanine amidase
MINLVISRSQQPGNRCAEGDTEQDHMGLIADALFDILSQDNRFNLYNIPKLTGGDTDNLYKLVDLSNEFINNNGGAGYHLSLHSDGGYKGSGVSGFYYSETGKAFGKPIYDEMCSLTPWSDMSFTQRTGLYELKVTNAVAFLLEVSFHDQSEQAKWIHANIKLIAQTIAKGIYKYFNLEMPSTELDYKTLYEADESKLNKIREILKG